MDKRTAILGQPLDPTKHYTILGGGISGLMIGFFLKRANVSFEILEKENRVGGLINTIEGKFGRVETGANGILWCPEIDYVAKSLGLSPLQPNQKFKKRFFVRDKKLRQFPLSIFETIGLIGRLLAPHSKEIKTVEDFGRTYLGQKVTDQVLSPALSGIYGTQAKDLSFEGATKTLAAIRGESNWLPLGLLKYKLNSTKQTGTYPKGLHSFPGGMKTLVESLADDLKDHIKVNSGIHELDPTKQYIITTSAPVAAKFIKHSEIRDILSKIEYQSIISATLFFKRAQFQRFKSGFGCLIPRNEVLKTLGVLFSSIIYPERIDEPDMLSLRCILQMDHETRSMSPEDLVRHLEMELDSLFGLSGNAHDAIIHQWENGLPIYNNNLFESWDSLDFLLREKQPNVVLFGNYTGEISVRGACQSAYHWTVPFRS